MRIGYRNASRPDGGSHAQDAYARVVWGHHSRHCRTGTAGTGGGRDEASQDIQGMQRILGRDPSFCTITESNLAAIPTGTKIFYYGPVTGSALYTSSSAVIAVSSTDSAVGYCIVYSTANPPLGTCAFNAGSGALAGFQAIMTVTVDDKQIWHWDGGYLLDAAD